MGHAEDELALRNLAYAYSDACGRKDPVAMAAVYAPDGELQVASTGVSVKGVAKLERAFRRLVEVDRAFLVQMTTGGVVEIKGDEANCRWWFTEIKQHTNETFYRYLVGVYEDVAVRLHDGWRFSQRRATAMFEWHLPQGGQTHTPMHEFLPIAPPIGLRPA